MLPEPVVVTKESAITGCGRIFFRGVEREV
jgi:hypothetical protein